MLGTLEPGEQVPTKQLFVGQLVYHHHWWWQDRLETVKRFGCFIKSVRGTKLKVHLNLRATKSVRRALALLGQGI